MTRLLFVVPVHGRRELTSICLRQLRRTCDALGEHGIRASAIIVGDGNNLSSLQRYVGRRLLGFGWVMRDNRFLSRKFNDGIQLAADPHYNPTPADFVVPCGSDDWVDHRLFLNLPDGRTVYGFQTCAFVREDGREIVSRMLRYQGGAGIRIYPRALLERLSYRPADEDRKRACDTSILRNTLVSWEGKAKVEHLYLHDFQIVDWKSASDQLNSYANVSHYSEIRSGDPWRLLAEHFPAESLEAMRAHYGIRDEVAA